MSLRLRLIVVFFLLSVVPLAAVTYYSYTSNVRAVRDAATRESDLLAGELSQRMQLVTAQLSERVEHLMDLQSMQASTAAARQTAEKPAATKPASTKPAVPAATNAPPPPTAAAAPPNMDQVYEAKVAQALGEAAMLLNNVELRGLGPRGDPGRQGRPPSPPRGGGSGQSQSTTIPSPGIMPPPAPTPPIGPVVPPANVGPTPPPGGTGGQHAGGGGRSQTPRSRPGGAGGRGANANAAGDQTAARTSTGTGTATGTGTGTAAGAGAGAVDAADAASRLMIDLAPIRREILKQIVPDGHLENLTPEERARIGRELNQRMLGIAQGLQLGAAGLQKRAADAEREAQATSDKAAQMSADAAAKSSATKAKAAEGTKPTERAKPTTVKVAPVVTPAATPTPAPAPAATPPPIKKKTELSGSHLGVVVEQNGQVVEQISAEINLPQLLATVFSTTRRDRGEVPF
jgi:hypothetical protein